MARVAALVQVEAAQPAERCRHLLGLFPMALPSKGDVALRDREGLGVFALAQQLPHLRVKSSVFVGILCLGAQKTAACGNRQEHEQHAPVPQPSPQHRIRPRRQARNELKYLYQHGDCQM